MHLEGTVHRAVPFVVAKYPEESSGGGFFWLPDIPWESFWAAFDGRRGLSCTKCIKTKRKTMYIVQNINRVLTIENFEYII